MLDPRTLPFFFFFFEGEYPNLFLAPSSSLTTYDTVMLGPGNRRYDSPCRLLNLPPPLSLRRLASPPEHAPDQTDVQRRDHEITSVLIWRP